MFNRSHTTEHSELLVYYILFVPFNNKSEIVNRCVVLQEKVKRNRVLTTESKKRVCSNGSDYPELKYVCYCCVRC